jgi:hypothetical protein
MVYNNSFYKNSGWGSEIAFSYRLKDTIISNNIIYGEGVVAENLSEEDNGQYQNITWGKNIWWGEDVSDTSSIQGDFVVKNPLYIDANGGDLKIDKLSPAINIGVKERDITTWKNSFWRDKFNMGIILSYGSREIHGELDIGAYEL